MKASQRHELVTDVPASELWKIYGTLRFAKLFRQLLPQILQKLVVVRGDGGVGTVLRVTLLPPGSSRPLTYSEEVVKVDNRNYVKKVAAIQGYFLDIGFTKFVIRVEITDKGPRSSVLRSSILYEFDDARPELEVAASVTSLALAASDGQVCQGAQGR